jgi:uncharacterized protein (DUF433 family)
MEGDQPIVLGRYVVADPKICHGKLTFRGTRIFVADVLSQVARGMDWESISEEWNGSVSHDAISEAVRLARDALLLHVEDQRLVDPSRSFRR